MTSPWHPSVPLCACKQGGCAHPVLVKWIAPAGKELQLTLEDSCKGRVYKPHRSMQCSVQSCSHNYNLIPSSANGIVCIMHLLHAQAVCKAQTANAAPHHDEKDEDVLYETRAHLTVWRTREWAECGTGKIKVLFHRQTKKIRLVMRADNTEQVCLNLPVDPELTIGHSGKKIRVLTDYDCVDEPPVMRSFRADFETPAMADDFTTMMDVVRDHLKENRTKTAAAAVQKQLRIPAASAADPVRLEVASLRFTQEADDPIKALIRAIGDLSAHRQSRLCSDVTSIASVMAQDVIATWPEIECLFEVYGWNSACKQFDGGVDMDGLQSLAVELGSNNLHSILNQLTLE